MNIPIKIASDLDMKHQQTYLEGFRPKCASCHQFGNFPGQFCSPCENNMNYHYRTFDELKAGFSGK